MAVTIILIKVKKILDFNKNNVIFKLNIKSDLHFGLIIMKYKEIVAELKNEIMTGKLSKAMPAMRILMERFQVSNLTIVRVYRELAEAGLINGGNKKKYLIPEIVSKENLVLCLMRPPKEINNVDNFSNEMCTGVIRATEMNHINVLFPHQNASVLYGSSDDAFLMQMTAEMRPLLPWIRGIITAASINDEQLRQYILPFAGNKPTIVLNRDSLIDEVGKVVFSSDEGCEALSRLILRQRCQKCVLCQTHLTTDHRNDHTLLLKKHLTAGGFPESEIILLENLLLSPDNSSQINTMAASVKTLPGDTLIFVSSSFGACYTADELAKRGFTAGKDYKLCSFDGKSCAKMYAPKITSVHISGSKLGEKAVELLLSENPLRKIHVNYTLQLQETL